MLVLWALLAITSFVGIFLTPGLWLTIVNAVFGSMNLLIVISLVAAYFEARRAARNNKKKSVE